MISRLVYARAIRVAQRLTSTPPFRKAHHLGAGHDFVDELGALDLRLGGRAEEHALLKLLRYGPVDSG